MFEMSVGSEIFGELSSSAGFIILWILAEIIWLVSVVKVANRRTKDPMDRVCWLLVILFLNILGSIMYWIAANPSRAQNSSSKDRQARSDAERERQIKERANRGSLTS